MQSCGFKVAIVAGKVSDNQEFLLGAKPAFPIYCYDELSKRAFPDTDCVISYMDKAPEMEIPKVKHVLYLQGFGSQNYDLECSNLAGQYDLVIATSSWLKRIAEEAGHAAMVVPPGIDSFFKPVVVPRIGLVTLGTLYHASPDKNVPVASAAFARVYSQRHGNVKAIYLAAKFPENVEEFGTYPFVYSFMINPPQRLLPAMYSACDVWVAPSINEGMGLTPLESMACGTPVVMYKNRGLDDFVRSGRNCLLVESPKEMAHAIQSLLKDYKLNKQICQGGQELARQFTWEKTFDGFKDALAKIGIYP
jgi:glycosyltransferase involved in cell wall biosynthesis